MSSGHEDSPDLERGGDVNASGRSPIRASEASDGASPVLPPSDGGVALYLQVAKVLEQQISSGKFVVGSLLPTEIELSEQFAVSRQTIRQAIRMLRNQGLLSARKGVGTRVEAASSETRFRHSVQSKSDLMELARESEMRVTLREQIAARGRLAADLGCRPGRKWLHVGGPRFHVPNPVPYCWAEVYLDGRYAPIVRDIDVFRTAIFNLVERESGERIVEIEQEIRATTISAERAPALSAQPGGLALQIKRRYLGAGRKLILLSINLLPADRFFYSTNFHAEAFGSSQS